MDPLTQALLLSLAGGAVGGLFGGGDKTVDTERPLRQKEKDALLAKIFKGIKEEESSAIGQSVAGLERRGLGSPGQVAGVTSRIKGASSEARGGALTDVNLATRGQTIIPGDDISGGIGDLSEALSFYLANRNKTKKGTGFTSRNFLDNIQFGR